MALTDDFYEVHKGRNGIFLGMNTKSCADGSEWSEHKKQKNEINFEFERRNIAWELNYFKQTVVQV